jgi:hypothetical protein
MENSRAFSPWAFSVICASIIAMRLPRILFYLGSNLMIALVNAVELMAINP